MSNARRLPLTQVAQDISHIPVSLSLLQGASVSVHVRSSPPLPLHSGSFNFSCATCVKAQGRGLINTSSMLILFSPLNGEHLRLVVGIVDVLDEIIELFFLVV